MVGSSLLGFRRPRFSEEVAWLPAWLQQHVDGESLDEQYINGGQNTLEQKGFTTGNNANLSSRDEGRYTSCHLFLSGEDNSPASFAPSSGKVVNFNLHLSADSKSQDTPSSSLDTSQAGRHANVSAVREETENQFRMGYNASVIGLSPFTSQQKTLDHICLQSLAKDKDSRMNREESGGYCMVSDINEAIELSIAASEALVIHDMVKSSAYTESLAAAAVLEVSLLVKQARLECLEDCFHFSTEDVNEIDCLSDLDEFHMADAFEDVGLSISNPDGRHACASGKSQVKDTPGSQNHYGCDVKYKYECLVPPKVVSDDIPRTQQSKYFLDIEKQGEKDWPVEVLDFGRQSKWVDDLTSNIDTSVVASHSDYLLDGSSLANSYVPATTEGGSFVIESMTAYPPQPSSNSSQQAWNYVTNETRDKLTSVGPDRFQSRWLGGWAWKKEVNVSTLVEHENATKVPRYLVGETSYLSESADIAPDESSFVQKQVKGSHMDSQSSISFPGLPSRPDEGILFSLDVVRSSSLSYVDPLCSVVPCSISSENACSTPAERTNNEFDVGECSRHESQDCNVNLQRASSPNPEWGTVEIVNGEGFQPTIRRHLTSLRSYSMLLPPCGAFAGNDNTYHNRSVPSEYISGLLSTEHDVGCKRDSTGLPSLKSLKKCSTARGIEENLEPSVVQNLVTNLINQERNCHETANDGTGLQVHTEKSRCSPVILNRGRRSRFWASKESANDFSGEENLQQSVVWKGDVGPHGKNLQTVEFKCKVAGDTEVPPRKQVRFLDAKIQLPQENSLQKLQSSNRASTTRAGKRLRYPKPKFVSTAQEVKRHQTICLAKNAKRLIFRDIEFLLTGLSIQKEKQLEGVIIKYGGIVRGDIPSPPKSRGKRSSTFKLQQLPIVLCFRKLETTKFLYGCAVNAYILDASWLTDSVAAGSALPPNKYMVIANHVGQECTRVGRPLCRSNHNHIFNRVGIMFQGKHSFCTRLAKVVKHGGGLVFKTLQWLVQNLDANRISVGAIVAEDENRVSRHLKHCASERKIPMMPASWIISSLHAGKLLPFLENKHYSPLPTIKISDFPSSSVLSEEI